MNHSMVLLSLAGLMLAFGCQQKEDKILKTESGYDYQWHGHIGKGSPEMGDHAFFLANMYAGDSMMHNSKLSPGGREHVQIREVPQEYSYFRPLMELLKQMGPGDSVSLWYPTDSMPGDPAQFRNIDTVRYELKMEEVMDSTAYAEYIANEQAKAQEQLAAAKEKETEITQFINDFYAKYKTGELDNQFMETTSGLKYIVHEEGNTGIKAEKGDFVEANYYGILEASGQMFDNSFRRGRTFKFPLGQKSVIPGWDEAFTIIDKGSRATFIVPYTLGYGKAGNPPTIPAEADLIFYVEFVDVIKS